LSTAIASNCSTQPTYDWNFGDGTAHSSDVNPTHAYTAAGNYTWTLTTSVGSGALMIDTIAGGLGEGNALLQAPFGVISAITRDPQGRGLYVADFIGGASVIRFLNTSNATVTLGGRSIASGTVRVIAGGGADFSIENLPALQVDLGTVTGLATSVNGDVVYYIDQLGGTVRGINVSAGNVTIAGQTINSGRIGTLASSPGSAFYGLAVHPTTGEVYVSDTVAGGNKVFKISSAGAFTPVAGSGTNTSFDAPFTPGPANSVPLLQPRAIKFDSVGALYVVDSGHGRVIKVDSGNATLVTQFTVTTPNGGNQNPYPSGIAIVGAGGNLYVTNGNQQTVYRVTGGVAKIAGTVNVSPQGVTTGVSCDYSSSTCGDDGPASSAAFNFLGSTGNPPLAAGIEADGNGLFVVDQSATSSGKGRIRYINLTGGAVTVAGVTVNPSVIRTIAGDGLQPPYYDGGQATGASFRTPVGVAVDGNGNLWVADTIGGRLRFVNRGANPITIFSGTPAQQTVTPGQIVTVNKDVGSGNNDGVPVNQATFDSPQGLFLTSQGLYVVDSKGGPSVPAQQIDTRKTSLIRFINTTSANVTLYPGAGANAITVPPGNVIKIAGGADETQPGNGNGQFATLAKFFGSSDVAVAANGTIYVTEVVSKVVRKIDGNTGLVSGLTLASKEYTGLGFDSSGRLLIANFTDGSVLRESSAGSGSFSNFATGLGKPRDVAGAPDGSAYVTDGAASSTSGNHRIVKIDSGGTTSVIAGGGSPGFSGDGAAATGGLINIGPADLVVNSGVLLTSKETVNIVVGPNGEVVFADANNNRIRRIASASVTCVRTGSISISGNNPAPVLTSINPNTALANSGAFTLTANGSGFAPTSVIRWNGQARTTTFVSATQLTASIPAGDLSSAGTVQVTVFTPTPGGGTSSAVNFTITQPNPVPTISNLSPNTAIEGGPSFTLTVNGTGFVNSSQVKYDGADRPTTFVNSTKLTAVIDSSDIIGVGQASVTVFNPTPGGGISNVSIFTITSGTSPVPVLSSISPNSISAGSQTFALIANGSNFAPTSKVRWNGTDLQTAFGSATQLTAQVPTNLVANVGTAQVTVFTPTPGGGTSAAQTFTITAVGNNPTPGITAISPPAVGVGSPSFTLVVTGTNFINGTKVRLNGNDRVTTFVSATQVNATILPGDVANVGDLAITTFNPSPGGGVSTAVILKVAPVVTSTNAASFSATQMTPESIVAAFGTGMATGVQIASTVPLPTNLLGTTVQVTDSAGTTRDAGLFFVAPLQVNFQIPPGTAEGTARVFVRVNNNIVDTGTIAVSKVGPGLFSANSDGAGIASAFALRVKLPSGAQSLEPVAQFNAGTGRFVPTPIDMGADNGANTDIVYLVLYGTGFRGRTSAANILVTLDGLAQRPLNAADFEDGFAAPGFIGLDQCNIKLSRALIGKGVINVSLTVDGKPSNTIQISIK
jgi:uncharacterized protein (TIGR03437 family)